MGGGVPLDRAAAAAALSVPVSFIDAIFSGEITPSDTFYRKLCDALGIPLKEKQSEDLKAQAAADLYNRNRENGINEDAVRQLNRLNSIIDSLAESKERLKREKAILEKRVAELEEQLQKK
jgi:hypothetical protein